MKQHILFFDIDGTILDVKAGLKDPSDATKNAIKTLQANGHLCFLATGRAMAYLNPKLLEIGFDGYVTNNGASVIFNGKEIVSHPFDKNELKEIVSFFDSQNIQYTLLDDKKAYAKESFKDVYALLEEFEVPFENTSYHFDIDSMNISKFETQPVNEEVADFLRSLKDKGYEVVEFVDMSIFEVTGPSVTKGKAILELLEVLNIPVENSIAFGDGYNDIEMLSNVGLGVAMGNAPEEVKKYANVVTDTCANDGIMKQLVKLGLI